jgi:predicted RNase H-like HicB family nuclease
MRVRSEHRWRTLITPHRLGRDEMASTTRDDRAEGVDFIHEDDGRVTARDRETGVASFGETKAEALRMLAEALELHEGGGEPVTDEDLDEWGLDSEEFDDEELPEFMQ